MIHDQVVRLYIIGYIPHETKFHPLTRNEIKACEWFPLADLPSSRKDMTPKLKMGVSPNAFFMVLPFVKRMRRWVSERSQKTFVNSSRRTRHKSVGDIDTSACKNKNKSTQHDQSTENSSQKYKNGPGNCKVATIGNCSGKKDRKHSKRQLFTPQNGNSSSFSPVNSKTSPNNGIQRQDVLTNFVAPSWANFKFDTRAILDCLT